MGFIESISSAFNNYFNFKGRSSKSAFWYFVLFEVIYFFIAGILLGAVGANDETANLAILVLILPIMIPGIALTARRIHDFNQSGWMQCIFIPGFFADEFLGTGYVIYVVTFVVKILPELLKGKTSKKRLIVAPNKNKFAKLFPPKNL